MKVATLVYCMRGDEVLLGMKKKNFGAGKWNGFGGKVKEGEGIEAAAIRELEEESGLTSSIERLEKIAKVSFYFMEQPMFEAHAFVLRSWSGEPRESEEMNPAWFPVAALPWEEMWPSDPYWVPQGLAGENTEAECRFDESGSVVERFTKLPLSF